MSVMTMKTEDRHTSLKTFEDAQEAVNSQAVPAIPTISSTTRRARASLKKTERALAIVPPLALAAFLFLAWYLGTVSGKINSLFLPTPADVWTALLNGLGSGMFLSNTLVTVQESVLGFLLALVIALPLGYGMAKSRLIAAALQPYLAAGQAIPAIVIAPLLVFWIGTGVLPIVILCMLVVLFPMVVTTMLGMETIDRTLIDAARVEGASGWPLLLHVEFPQALPALLAGVRTGLTLSVTGALVGEFVASGDSGLGSLLQILRNQFDTPSMFATLIILAGLAAAYYGFSWLLKKLANAIYG